MKQLNKKTTSFLSTLSFIASRQKSQAGTPNKLELFEHITNTRTIVTASDYARRAKPFEKNITAKGFTFKTDIGSFKLTVQHRHDHRIVFTLDNVKDRTRLTARLLTDPNVLFDFRNHQNFLTATLGTFPTFNRTSPRIPCLIIEWREATCERSDLNREILPQILTAAAFGHLKYWRQIARRVEKIILYSPPSDTRPFLNFSSRKTAPAVTRSTR